MTFSRVCGKCGCVLNKENTGGLKWLQPACNRCTHSNPTCTHNFKLRSQMSVCVLCGFDKNYKQDLIK